MLSAKTEYACLAVLALAAHFNSGDVVRVRAIASEHGIPLPFLVQIMLQLKSAGWVASTRGASGGYRLVHPPHQISLGALVELIEGNAKEIRSNLARPSAASEALVEAWSTANAAHRQQLSEITFADLLEQSQASSQEMYYI
jgi:Rrf2 family protein